ncbi:STAS domain-containing protein [Flindersiella endophytica]
MDLTKQIVNPTTAVVGCKGRLTMVTALQLKAFIDETVAAGHNHIVIDLAETGFIDSSGLGVLIGGLKHTRQSGGDLRIAAPTEQVRAALDLTKLDRILRPYDQVQSAVDAW